MIVLFTMSPSSNNKAFFWRDDDHKMIVKVKLWKPISFPSSSPPEWLGPLPGSQLLLVSMEKNRISLCPQNNCFLDNKGHGNFVLPRLALNAEGLLALWLLQGCWFTCMKISIFKLDRMENLCTKRLGMALRLF